MTISLTKQQLLRLSVAGIGISSLISIGSYLLQTGPLTQQALSRQRQLLTINRNRIAQWWQQEVRRVENNLETPEIIQPSLVILQAKRQLRSNKNSAASLGLRDELALHDANRNSVSLLTKGGIVVFSTDQQRLGMYQPLKNTTTSLELEELGTSPLNFFTDSISNQPSISVALPITTGEQKRAGFLAIDLNLRQLTAQLTTTTQQRIPKQQQQVKVETYLAARTTLDRITLIAPPKELTREQARRFSFDPLESLGLRRALDGESGEGLYLNSASQPVIGVYTALPNFRSALM
ncbi:MAG: hypothetical protein RLZZ11_1183, partial [Cyanobacteriota bacterium]